ncbi:MAG: peptidoglycan DD-metalloendopeptidase family protein [Desulfobacteraceae bacterium]|jgi:septal ring factor EnvC (AmiA/AmiB activator)
MKMRALNRHFSKFSKKTVVPALVAAGLFISPTTPWAENIGTILVSDLRMRSGPGTDYRILSLLPKGARVAVLEDQDGWLEIEHHGWKGFIVNDDAFIKITVLKGVKSATQAGDLKKSAADAETIKRQLRRARSELASISRKESDILEAFNRADEALDLARRKVRIAKNGLVELEQEISVVQHRTAALEKEIEEGERYAAKRLVALYKLDWVGKIHLLATADSFFDFISRKEALERILSQDEVLLEALNRNKTKLVASLTHLNTRKAEKRALELTLQERITTLGSQQKRRKQLLKTIGSKKSLRLAAIEALRQAALELDATIKHIEPAAADAMLSQDPIIGDKSFESYKGLLSWPVKGKITSFFGPFRDKNFAVTNFQSGINIQAERGEPIRSVSNGHVIFSNWFKGFGNMIIIDHGHHYYTVYAHLEELFKVKGDRVDQGEVIATVGDSGSMEGPALHFEVRHHGKPIDPLVWIQKG